MSGYPHFGHGAVMDNITNVVHAVERARGADSDKAALPTIRIIGIDGRSGSGKSHLAEVLANAVAGARVLHLEDAYRGWNGLVAGLQVMARDVLEPLANGREGTYQRWDWEAETLGETVRVPLLGPHEFVIVEGCGALAEPCAPYLDLRIWCEASEVARRNRVLTRDPYDWSERWDVWAAQEDALDYRESADILFLTDSPETGL